MIGIVDILDPVEPMRENRSSPTDALLAFELFLHERVRRGDILPSTAHFYVADVRQHLEWLNKEGVDIADVTKTTIETWHNLQKSICGAGTVRRRLVSLRQFYGFLQASSIKSFDPTIGLELSQEPASAQRTGKRLGTSTIQELLNAPNPATIRGLRDRAILQLIAVHGIRVSEIHRMNLDDVDLRETGGRILCIPSRKERQRLVLLTDDAQEALRTWLAARRLMHPSNEAVFIALHWTDGRCEPYQRLSPRGIRQVVDSYLVRVGAKSAGFSCNALRFAATHAQSSAYAR